VSDDYNHENDNFLCKTTTSVDENFHQLIAWSKENKKKQAYDES
jgi:hypothetical protein